MNQEQLRQQARERIHKFAENRFSERVPRLNAGQRAYLAEHPEKMSEMMKRFGRAVVEKMLEERSELPKEQHGANNGRILST